MLAILKSYYGNMFNFSGRARRKEYWLSYLWVLILVLPASCLVGIPVGILSAVVDADLSWLGGILGSLVGIVISFPMISLTVRRFHDIGKSGWWYLICYLGNLCCGIGSIVMLIFCCLDSQPGTNQYGPNPKGIGDYSGGFNNPNQYQNNPQYGGNMNQQYNNNQYGQGPSNY